MRDECNNDGELCRPAKATSLDEHLNNDSVVPSLLVKEIRSGQGGWHSQQQIIVRDATDNLLRSYLLNALLRNGAEEGGKNQLNILH